MASKLHHVKIIHEPGKGSGVSSGLFTQVVDAETGEPLPLVYGVKFESSAGGLATATVETFAVITDIDTQAAIVGTDPKDVLATLHQALADAGVTDHQREVIYSSVAELLYPKAS